MGWSARKLLQSKKERNWSGGCLPAWRGLSAVNARDHWQDSPAIRSPSLVVVRGMQGAQNGSQTGPLGYGSAIPPTYQEPQSGTLSGRLEGQLRGREHALGTDIHVEGKPRKLGDARALASVEPLSQPNCGVGLLFA
jgi:hypothetical protein